MDYRPSSILLLSGIALGIGATIATQKFLASGAPTRTSPDNDSAFRKPPRLGEDVKNGLEECIGNTPLVRIKCLSEATGCEILGKAEVRLSFLTRVLCGADGTPSFSSPAAA